MLKNEEAALESGLRGGLGLFALGHRGRVLRGEGAGTH